MAKEIFDTAAADYDSWYETELGHLVDKVERELAEKMFKPSGVRVLEVGSGTGLYTVWLARQGYEIMAVEISPEMMKRAQAKMTELGLKAEWRLADVAKILPELGKFHGIISLTAFEFIPDPEQVLHELYNHLEPGGCLMIGIIAGGGRWGDFYKQIAGQDPESVFNHAVFYTEEQIRNWQVGSKPEIGKALFFPPNVDSLDEARKMEELKTGNPGYFVAKWVKE
jgi:2-polyprenyl-3-methyl-5-hydroxy-6-metoxy-1,4-benzoquinol methylase